MITRKPKSGPTHRSGGTRSVVAAAAYRSGERLHDQARGIEQDYSKTDRVLSSEIYLPEGAKPEFQDRAKLWNAVEAVERRGDAQLAREVTLSLPAELTLEQNKELVESYVKDQFVSRGMAADVNIHTSPKGDKRNIHAHVLLSTRELSIEGFGLKNRDWNDRSLVNESRELWAERVNEQLERNFIFHENIDHTSYKKGLSKALEEHEKLLSKLSSGTNIRDNIDINCNLIKIVGYASIPKPHIPMVVIQRERKGLESELSSVFKEKIKKHRTSPRTKEMKKLHDYAQYVGYSDKYSYNKNNPQKIREIKDRIRKKKNNTKQLQMVNKKLIEKEPKERTLFDNKPELKKPNEIKPEVLSKSNIKEKINVPHKKKPLTILERAKNSKQEQKIMYNELLNKRDYNVQGAVKSVTREREKMAASVEAQIKKEFEPEKRKLAEKIDSIEKEMKKPLFFMKSQERKQALSVELRQSEAMKKAIQAQIKSKKEYCQELRDPEKIKEIAKSKVLEENPTLARQIDQVRSIGLEHEKQERAEKREHSKNKGRDFSRGIER